MVQKKIDPDIDALVKRIFALKPESKARVIPELKMVAKGPKRATEEVPTLRPARLTVMTKPIDEIRSEAP